MVVEIVEGTQITRDRDREREREGILYNAYTPCTAVSVIFSQQKYCYTSFIHTLHFLL